MSSDPSSPSSDIRESKSEDAPLPPAWQPLTPRGVAAFARARFGRLLLVQSVIALLVVASVIWFLGTGWFPVIRQAIRQLPDTGLIQNQQLISPRTSTAPLGEGRLLALVMDVDGTGTPSLATDLRAEFRRRGWALCSFLGCLYLDYPKERTVPFNRPDLESRWAAWEAMIYITAGLATLMVAFASWLALATLYCPVARIYSFYKDREITLVGSWKLAAAALLPGALLVASGIVLYGLGVIDLDRFVVLWTLHWVVSWVYLFVAPLRLPRTPDASPTPRDPFGLPRPPRANPFASSTGGQ
jgi:hypothetical protein